MAPVQWEGAWELGQQVIDFQLKYNNMQKQLN
jgi:hypothetical protein